MSQRTGEKPKHRGVGKYIAVFAVLILLLAACGK